MNVYLHLFHGRKRASEQLENWGEDGPVLGPFRFVHTTYATLLHLGDMNGDTHCDLDIMRGLVVYGDMLYGDWSVFGEDIYQKGRANGELTEAVMPDAS